MSESNRPPHDSGPRSQDVTAILEAWSEGDQSALDRLTPLVYDELHRLAAQYMRRERLANSVQTSALVNEAYIRLVDYRRMRWQPKLCQP